MTDILVREVWRTGVSDPSADPPADAWDEENDGRRIYWVPKGGPWASGAAPGNDGRQYDDTIPQGTQNNPVDTFRGGPGMRREHLFDVQTLGYERMFVQWAGEVVASVNFTPAGAVNGRNFFADQVRAAAWGMPFTNPLEPWTYQPPVVCHAARHRNTLWSTMANSESGGGRDDEASLWANGHRLYVKGPGLSFPGFATPRDELYGASPAAIAMGDSSNVLTKAGLFWGYTQITGGVPEASPPVNGVGSRMPQTGDQLGFILEMGWPDLVPYDSTASPGPAGTSIWPVVGKLSIEPFERVMFCIMSIGDNGAFVGYTPPVSHFVKGSVYVILTKKSVTKEPERIFIDRQGRVTILDAYSFHSAGLKRL